MNLPLGQRRIDIFFAIVFILFALTSGIADSLPTLGIALSPDSPNFLARANYDYAFHYDPLFLHAPIWMRFVTGLSAFVYGPFYLVLAYALIKAKFLSYNLPYVLIPLLLLVRMRKPAPFARPF